MKERWSPASASGFTDLGRMIPQRLGEKASESGPRQQARTNRASRRLYSSSKKAASPATARGLAAST
jgi:hypothetical protein